MRASSLSFGNSLLSVSNSPICFCLMFLSEHPIFRWSLLFFLRPRFVLSSLPSSSSPANSTFLSSPANSTFPSSPKVYHPSPASSTPLYFFLPLSSSSSSPPLPPSSFSPLLPQPPPPFTPSAELSSLSLRHFLYLRQFVRNLYPPYFPYYLDTSTPTSHSTFALRFSDSFIMNRHTKARATFKVLDETMPELRYAFAKRTSSTALKVPVPMSQRTRMYPNFVDPFNSAKAKLRNQNVFLMRINKYGELEPFYSDVRTKVLPPLSEEQEQDQDIAEAWLAQLEQGAGEIPMLAPMLRGMSYENASDAEGRHKASQGLQRSDMDAIPWV
eukprot:GHVS01005483.1.p1 GENE.GHVS01005483.1~~GHVS01005483.1.p1  ORF type:complete len:328 (-),score=72.33 GHVS01005483.1:166-1149(-)